MTIEPKVIEDFARGGHDAFRRIFVHFYPRVRAFVRGFVKDTGDAEDLTQVIFIKLWDKRARFAQVRRFDAYLFVLAKYTVFNYIAAKSVVPVFERDAYPEQSDGHTPHDELAANDLRLLVDMVVDGMPPQRRQVFLLSRAEGLSNEQIAGRLGIRKKTVENHLNLALKEIRKVVAWCVLLFSAT